MKRWFRRKRDRGDRSTSDLAASDIAESEQAEPKESSGREDTSPQRSAISTDEPITSRAQDRLGRTRFAEIIAAEIASAPKIGGFVVAVTGAWGGGKTSVINMAIETLEEHNDATVLRFNPWLFSGTEQLVEHFFRELATQLGETEDEKLAGIGKQLATYGRLAGPILRAVPVVGGTLELASTVAQGAGQALQGAQESVESRRKKLRAALVELEQPLAVVVDDIDRLRRDEIAHVVRLVRLVGDFPNVVYVLAFDRARVERALGGGDTTEQKAEGREYLEKIVQIAHEVPEPDPARLTALLEEELNAAVGDTSRLYADQEAIINVIARGIHPMISTLRDVRRFVNVLPATILLVGDEIELADILGLEAIKVFAPDSHRLMLTGKEALTEPSSMWEQGSGRQQREEGYKNAIEGILAAAGSRREEVEELIRRLFPAAERHLPHGIHYGSNSQAEWRRKHRVAHTEVFDIYLNKTLPEGVLPAREVEEVFEALEDRDALEAHLAQMEPEALEAMLERLEAYEEEFPKARPEIPIAVLSNQGDRLSTELRGMFEMRGDMKVRRVLLRLMRGLEPEDLSQAVVAALPMINSLSGRITLITMVGYREGASHKLIEESEAWQLEAQNALEILEADPEELSRERDLRYLIGRAYQWDEAATRTKVIELCDDDVRFIRLLRGSLMESVGGPVTSRIQQRTLQLNWPALVELIGEDRLIERIKAMPDTGNVPELDERGLAALQQARRYADDPALAEQEIKQFED